MFPADLGGELEGPGAAELAKGVRALVQQDPELLAFQHQSVRFGRQDRLCTQASPWVRRSCVCLQKAAVLGAAWGDHHQLGMDP